MQTVFHIEPQELNINFIEGLKALFQNRKLTITVEAELDATDKLLQNPKMLEIIENRISNIEKGLVTEVDIDKYLVK